MAEILSLSPDLLTYGQSHLGVDAFIRAANNLFASELGRAAMEAVREFPGTQSRRDALRRRAFARLSRECARKAPKVEDWVLHALIEMALQESVATDAEPVSAMESFYL
jgi:hypothetical protein